MKALEPTVSYKSILYQKSFGFSIRIVKLIKYLLNKDTSYKPIDKQLLRSGTSIGAKISEAQSAPTKKILLINSLSLLKKQENRHIGLDFLKELKF
jgi:four helix bundle protein